MLTKIYKNQCQPFADLKKHTFLQPPTTSDNQVPTRGFERL